MSNLLLKNNIIESVQPYQLDNDHYDHLKKVTRSLSAASNRLKAEFEALQNKPISFADACLLEKLCNSVICDAYIFNETATNVKYLLTKRLCGTF